MIDFTPVDATMNLTIATQESQQNERKSIYKLSSEQFCELSLATSQEPSFKGSRVLTSNPTKKH